MNIASLTKEQFVVDVIFKLVHKPYGTSLDEMNPEAYGISRATAWRALRNLREAGYVMLSGEWLLTEHARELFCGQCKHYKDYIQQAQQRHRETSQLILQRARQR